MLEEYVKEQLEKLLKNKEELLIKLKALTDEEKEAEKSIKALMDQEDVGVEIFSPRSQQNSIKQKIKKIQEHIEEIRFKQAETTSLLEQNSKNTEKWENLLNNIKNTNGELSPKPFNDQIYKDDMTDILKRIDGIIEEIQKDPQEALGQLKNLRYFIGALLTDRSDVSRET